MSVEVLDNENFDSHIDTLIFKVEYSKGMEERIKINETFKIYKSHIMNILNNEDNGTRKLTLKECIFCIFNSPFDFNSSIYDRMKFVLLTCIKSNKYRFFIKSFPIMDRTSLILKISDHYRSNNKVQYLTDEETDEYMKTQHFGQSYNHWTILTKNELNK